MSTKEAISTMATTVSSTGATLASSPKLDVEAEDDEEEPSTTFDALDMDLVNGPNPWLPAYGFQLQHRSHFQPTHEDLRTNDTVLVQQVDFLETILEETSDDLQSDSDRSGTTYWVGSDSETESVIHIRANRLADERLDGSGSECNSGAARKKRRRGGKYNGGNEREHQAVFDDYPASPRSSRSSASSRSSSLLQFESLERTCATLSPSSYSFDSLEYPNRSNASHPGNTSPDSLEQDYDKALPNGFGNVDHFSRIRPYRSFESLDTCQKEEEEFGHGCLTNGFTPLYLKRNAELSGTRSNGYHRPSRFTDKSQSAPSLLTTVDESTRVPSSRSFFPTSNHFASISSNLFENYTRVASVPVDLNLCGVEATRDDDTPSPVSDPSSVPREPDEMAEVSNSSDSGVQSGEKRQSKKSLDEEEEEEAKRKKCSSSVRTQGSSYNAILDGRMVDEECAGGEHCSRKRVTSTVKTQDRALDGMGAIEQLKRSQFEEDSSNGNAASDGIDGGLTTVERTPSGKQQRPWKVKNNASYELAQQFEIDERNFRSSKWRREIGNESEKAGGRSVGRKRKVLNNASYELAQQCDYIKALQSCRGAFQRMDACDELEEPILARKSSLRLRVSDMVQQMSSSSTSNLTAAYRNDERSYMDTRPYSKSTENISTQFSTAPFTRIPINELGQRLLGEKQKEKEVEGEEETLLSQIKKNSDPFSIYGDDPSARALVDDEVDLPCLETKPIIGTSSVEGSASQGTSSNETIPHRSFSTLERVGSNACNEAAVSSAVSKDLYATATITDTTDADRDAVAVVEASSCSKRSFIGDFYPEKIVRLQQREGQRENEKEEEEEEAEEEDHRPIDDPSSEDKNESPSTIPTTVLSSSACNGRNGSGELLWRVIVEKQEKEATVEKVTKREEENEKRKKREKEREKEGAEEARGHEQQHGVHGVGVGPPPGGSSNSDGLEPDGERSGNPAVAVAVDTNHRGDRDKRHEENAAATTAPVRVNDNDDNDDDNEEEGHAATVMSATTTTTTTATTTNAKPRLFVTPASPVIVGPTIGNNDTSAARFQRNMVVDASSATTVKEERKKGGLGGFLQRFSRLRFSGRSKVPRSEVQKKSDTIGQVNRAKVTGEEKVKKEPDYIIIPLHPPEEERQKQDQQQQNVAENRGEDTGNGRTVADVQRSTSNISANGRAPVSSKPPLPPQPPRFGALGSRASTGASAATAAACSSRRRAATDLGNPAAIEMAKARTMQAAQERPVGLLETDLDEAVVPSTTTPNAASTGKKTRSLLNLNHTSTAPRPRPEHALHVPQSPVAASHRSPRDKDAASTINQRPHKSMEFLLDKENLHFVKPPENELQKVGERVPSEHELRVQRSLQRLNVPDWYKNSPAARDGFRLKRHSDASQHGGWRALGSKTTSLSSLSSSSNRQPTTGALLSPSPTPPVFSRWSTSLLNSAGSSPASSARSSFNHRQPYLGWRSQERLTNPRTPAERLAQGILPQLQAANKQQQQQQQQQTTNQQLEVRNSIKEVTSAIVHYVQSGQEVGGGGRLSPRPRPEDWDDRGGARSTSPRGSVKLCWMESSFVGTRPVDSPETPMSLATETDCCPGCNATATETCSCVDSATSGLFLDLTPTHDDAQQHQQQQQIGGGGSLCPSPSSSLNYHHHHHHHRQLHHQQQSQQQQRHHRGSGQSDTDEAMATAALLRNKPSPGSTTLEDVLDSLLGLPSASRTPSPGPGPVVTGTSTTIRHRTNVGQANAKAGKSCSDLRQDLQESAKSVVDVQGTSEERASYYMGELVRRKSEGSDTTPLKTGGAQSQRGGGPLAHRRVSFDSNQEANGLVGCNIGEKMIRCRNNKCSNTATLAEAKRTYKSCHNCTCLYCSRECRRAHWQRHRRTCLHSRAGSLCKQVLSSAKEDPVTLKHISALAKRGHAFHGRGAVKCFFSSPEAAEKFIANGFVDLGEPTYVRWSDLLAREMGAELYAEVIRLCKSYNPDTRLVLYVAVCVVSEVPTSGAVKWERQLVSRCAKIHLDTANRHHTSSSSASPQGRQQSTSPCNITREMESPEMLVLTSLPGNNGQNTPKRIREISFNNIQRQLKLRGVSLRRHFPQVYRKLRAYVDGTVDKFAPVTIYPRDQASGKSFMCIIMLGVEPERLQLLPTDSSRVRTVDISVEEE
ncbi:uncharacterized protein LOC108001888 isoform X7 [Apis cerana]|uniref:uncharacterized protein LOC108001888 isoform X7 n=1 Tax=Apis cerana TaxID=7461 RepID=UPI002B23930F|nr:uncharacterized protein LOC108001888 isoform X7 [Apis cerana]XP_061928946.1 uncharacterized protein LOC108001888 isoform X7 [Apis cerana]XP_061928948.1 uncharacterized protein LOC108001888 isoform X7 [Apis cerana]